MNIVEDMARLIHTKASSLAKIDGVPVNGHYLYAAQTFMTAGWQRSYDLAQQWIDQGVDPAAVRPEATIQDAGSPPEGPGQDRHERFATQLEPPVQDRASVVSDPATELGASTVPLAEPPHEPMAAV